jgi:hypothetical protein
VGTKGDVVFIFEIKWRIKEAGYKEIEKFLDKIGRSEFSSKPRKLIFISKRGFTAQAVEYARINNVVLVMEREISEIRKSRIMP